MTDWHQCEWCEGDGGWHADQKPIYANPSKYVDALLVLRESISEMESEGSMCEGGDLRGWIAVIDDALKGTK